MVYGPASDYAECRLAKEMPIDLLRGGCMSEFDPKVLVEHIDEFGKGLNEWEVKFIAGLIDNPPEFYSEKQQVIINRIYDEKC